MLVLHNLSPPEECTLMALGSRQMNSFSTSATKLAVLSRSLIENDSGKWRFPLTICWANETTGGKAASRAQHTPTFPRASRRAEPQAGNVATSWPPSELPQRQTTGCEVVAFCPIGVRGVQPAVLMRFKTDLWEASQYHRKTLTPANHCKNWFVFFFWQLSAVWPQRQNYLNVHFLNCKVKIMVPTSFTKQSCGIRCPSYCS